MKFKDWFRVNWLTEAFYTNNMNLITGNISYFSIRDSGYIFRYNRMKDDNIFASSTLFLKNMTTEFGDIYFHKRKNRDTLREATHEEKRLLISEETGVGLYYSVDAHSIF